MKRAILTLLVVIVLPACTSSKYIEKRHAWWESKLTNMVRVEMEKSDVIEFLRYNEINNSYVKNENAFYIMERKAHKWLIGYTDLWIRIYLDENGFVRRYKVEEIHTSL